MSPLLHLQHDWHRARAIQRAGKGKPPPLVTAGLDLDHHPGTGRALKVGGMAIVFGAFPPSLADLLMFARARLHLAPEQARALDPVLRTRILAMWAWLPGPRCDAYLEFDRATDEAHAWLLGPAGPQPLALDPIDTTWDASFLEGLVLAGPACWGGEAGLARLVERFGNAPLLIAARLADHLERRRRDPSGALTLAQTLWPRLRDDDEAPWALLAGDDTHPYASVQLGRLALRLGHHRAARLLLQRADAIDAPAQAWYDLGQACERLDDLPGTLAAWVRYVGIRGADAEGWRHLLLARIRSGELQVADEALRKYHESGGKDDTLAEHLVDQVLSQRLRLVERANLAGWLGSRLDAALARSLSADRLAERLAVARRSLAPTWMAIRPALNEDAARLGSAGPEEVAARADALGRTALLALPLLAAAHPAEEMPDDDLLCAQVQRALSLWCEHRLRLGLRWMGVPAWLRQLARVAR